MKAGWWDAPTSHRLQDLAKDIYRVLLIGIHSKQGSTPLLVGMQLQEKEAQKY